MSTFHENLKIDCEVEDQIGAWGRQCFSKEGVSIPIQIGLSLFIFLKFSPSIVPLRLVETST